MSLNLKKGVLTLFGASMLALGACNKNSDNRNVDPNDGTGNNGNNPPTTTITYPSTMNLMADTVWLTMGSATAFSQISTNKMDLTSGKNARLVIKNTYQAKTGEMTVAADAPFIQSSSQIANENNSEIAFINPNSQVVMTYTAKPTNTDMKDNNKINLSVAKYVIVEPPINMMAYYKAHHDEFVKAVNTCVNNLGADPTYKDHGMMVNALAQ